MNERSIKAASSKRQYLKKKWRVIRDRVENKYNYYPTYIGLDYISQDEFVLWAICRKDFIELHDKYISSGFDRSCSPSIDRIIPCDGYVEKNMRFITISENTVIARQKRWKITTPDGVILDVVNMAKFCRENNLQKSALHQVASGIRSHHKGYKAENYENS